MDAADPGITTSRQRLSHPRSGAAATRPDTAESQGPAGHLRRSRVLRRRDSHRQWIPAALRDPAALLTDRLEEFAARRLGGIVTVNEHMNARFLRLQPRSIAVHNYPPQSTSGSRRAGNESRLSFTSEC